MLAWILRALSPQSLRQVEPETISRGADALAFLDRHIAGMPQILRPLPDNDDLMAKVVEDVERDLRVAGYLR